MPDKVDFDELVEDIERSDLDTITLVGTGIVESMETIVEDLYELAEEEHYEDETEEIQAAAYQVMKKTAALAELAAQVQKRVFNKV